MKKHNNLNITLRYKVDVTDIEKVFVTTFVNYLEKIQNIHIYVNTEKRMIYEITTKPDILFYRKPSQLFELFPINFKNTAYTKELLTLQHAVKMYEGMLRFA